VASETAIKLDHCVIHVSDWERSNDFYARVLHVQVVARGKGYAYRIGDNQLNCHGPAVEAGPVTRHGAKGQGTSVYFRDPDGSLLEFISYAEASR
jgi:catechol 2,3-dioxygenase-like lactoylglutathione lyase family enzyme